MSLNNTASTDSSQTENKASCTWITPEGGTLNEAASFSYWLFFFVRLNQNPPNVVALQNNSMHISDKGGRHRSCQRHSVDRERRGGRLSVIISWLSGDDD